MNEESSEGFIGFCCGHCHTEIEATIDMIGETTECPACGTKLIVPDNRDDGIERHSQIESSKASTQAIKSRTIRIELPDL